MSNIRHCFCNEWEVTKFYSLFSESISTFKGADAISTNKHVPAPPTPAIPLWVLKPLQMMTRCWESSNLQTCSSRRWGPIHKKTHSYFKIESKIWDCNSLMNRKLLGLGPQPLYTMLEEAVALSFFRAWSSAFSL